MNTVNGTVRLAGTRRREVRRPAVDEAWATALSELPPALRPLARQNVENMKDGIAIRSALSAELTRAGYRWRQIDAAIQPLL